MIYLKVTYHKTMRKNAFTLIELLAALAVVAILAAILIPVISGVRASAQSAASASNLRQIVAAAKLWTNENDGWILARSDGSRMWHNVLIEEGYASPEIFRHPTDEREEWDSATFPVPAELVGFGLNFRTFGALSSSTSEPRPGGSAYVPIKAAQLQQFDTANLLYYAESAFQANGPDLVQRLVYPDDGESWHMVNFEGKETANAAFFDGSVRAVTKQQVKDFGDPNGLWRPMQPGNGSPVLF